MWISLLAEWKWQKLLLPVSTQFPHLLPWYEAELWLYNSNSVAHSSVHEMNESLSRSGSWRSLYMHIDFPTLGLTDSEMQMTEKPGSLWQVSHMNLID